MVAEPTADSPETDRLIGKGEYIRMTVVRPKPCRDGGTTNGSNRCIAASKYVGLLTVQEGVQLSLDDGLQVLHNLS
jgi:hypothetical protein